MGKYQKKPIPIEAFQWFGDERQTEDPEWIVKALGEGGVASILHLDGDKIVMQINTPEGVMTANQGDYVIKGIHGEIYPCKPDIFEESYVKVKEAVSNRGIRLITQPNGKRMLTAEDYMKWYDLFLIEPDGTVKTVGWNKWFDEGWHDHCIVPHCFKEMAKMLDADFDEATWKAVCSMYKENTTF